MPRHVEHIAVLASLRRALELISGPNSTLVLASKIYGLYAAFVHFTSVRGGLIVDSLIGREVAVAIGTVLMSAGLIEMALDASFHIALVPLSSGYGPRKGIASSKE